MPRSRDLFLNETIRVQIASPVTFTALLNMSRTWSIPIIMPIASAGRPTELNTMFSVIIPTDGTAAVPIEDITAVKITVKRALVLRSIPYAWAANMTAQPCMMAVPSMLIVAPSGTVNEEISSDTPISESFDMVSGIVAFDDEDENAKNCTEVNFLKKLRGFNLVNATSSDGYTRNACMAKHNSTHPIYLAIGIKPSKPSVEKVLAIKQKIPIGANFITIRVISIMILSLYMKNLLTISVSSLNFANIMPTSTPKIMTGNISPFARA